MKKLFTLALMIILCLSLTACGGTPQTSGNEDASTQTPPNLVGEWKQTNSNSEDSWQAATIEGNTITVYWVSDNGDTKSLYWAGTFDAPTTTEEPYTWSSINDTEQTASALLASGDETKSFTYEDGEVSYEASALGTTTTVRLEKAK